MTIPPRIPITANDIDRVLARFYTMAREDPVLAPIFAAHVTDWPYHEIKIGQFWRNALLFERGYDGNPMQAHRAAGNVTHAHFATWLQLFDIVLHAELPPATAQAWSHLAHRIGHGLKSGLPAPAGHDATVPYLA